MVSDFAVPGLHYFLITSGMKGQDTFNDLSYLFTQAKANEARLNIKGRIFKLSEQ